MIFDSTFIFVIIAFLLGMAAQFWLKSVFNRYSQVNARSGVTADRVARKLLDRFGLTSVEIQHVAGELTDHYDPRNKSIGLSDSVFGNSSIAAIGVAAHEVGHAIQHDRAYSPLAVRNAFVPVVGIGSNAAMPLFIVGIFANIPMLMTLAIILFTGAVVFHLVTLPIEFNASSRAVTILRETGTLNAQELDGVGRVLNAAALTYVAAAALAVVQLIRLLVLKNMSD